VLDNDTVMLLQPTFVPGSWHIDVVSLAVPKRVQWTYTVLGLVYIRQVFFNGYQTLQLIHNNYSQTEIITFATNNRLRCRFSGVIYKFSFNPCNSCGAQEMCQIGRARNHVSGRCSNQHCRRCRIDLILIISCP